MKIIKDSGANHWALLQQHECEKCTTVFQPETERDFRDSYAGGPHVFVVCPRCSREQRMYKRVKTQTIYPWWNPYGTGGVVPTTTTGTTKSTNYIEPPIFLKQ